MENTYKLDEILDGMGCTVRYNLLAQRCELHQEKPTSSSLPFPITTARIMNDRKHLCDELKARAAKAMFNPVLEMIESKSWDGVDRLEHLYSLLGNISTFEKLEIEKWLMQAVAVASNKAYCVGWPNRSVLVLVAPKGVGKSLFFKKLTSWNPKDFYWEYHCGRLNDPYVMRQLETHWICDLGEVHRSALGSNMLRLENYLTRLDGEIHVPFRGTTTYIRRSCFCATARNLSDVFLNHPFINVNWLPVVTDKMNVQGIMSLDKDWVQQLWAQVNEMWMECPDGDGYCLTHEERIKSMRLMH